MCVCCVCVCVCVCVCARVCVCVGGVILHFLKKKIYPQQHLIMKPHTPYCENLLYSPRPSHFISSICLYFIDIELKTVKISWDSQSFKPKWLILWKSRVFFLLLLKVVSYFVSK